MLKRLFILVITLLFIINKAEAQQTIINIPSTEILAKGKFFARNSNRFRPFQPNPYILSSFNLTAGAGFRTEGFFAIIPINITDQAGNIFEEPRLDLAFKSALIYAPKTRLVGGSRISASLSIAITPLTFSYVLFSRQFLDRGPRITSGIYLANRDDFFDQDFGVLLGFEQIIVKDRLIAAIDWISGNRPYGFLAPGLKFSPVKSAFITLGVLIPNGNRARTGFILSFAKYLN